MVKGFDVTMEGLSFMSNQLNSDSQIRRNISKKTSSKTLEILLHTLSGNVKISLNDLMSNSSTLDQHQREQLGLLKDSIDRMELILNKSINISPAHSVGSKEYLDSDVKESIQVEKILSSLATNTSTQDSDEFFKYCVKSLVDLYDSRFAFIGLIKTNENRIQTLCVWAGDRYAENFEYELTGTPCNDVITQNKELIPTNVRELYPDDELLTQMGIDSYFGAPLITKDLGVIGIVSVMDDKPMILNEWTSPVLSVFASRISLEVLRKKAMDKLVVLNKDLEFRVKQRTQELELSNEELRAFCYSVSHDLRAPVRSINSFLDIVFEDFGDELSNEVIQFLNRVKHSGRHLDELITSMLSLSKVSQKDMMLKNIDLTQMFRTSAERQKSHHADREIEISIEENMRAWGDEGLLNLALDNLVSNAWKYTAKVSKPIITIGSYRKNKKTIFFIKDNGVGFDADYSSQLFQPFQRMHSSEEFEGVGVGLATTRRVINRHGGKIWVEAEKGAGATFYFDLGESKPIRI